MKISKLPFHGELPCNSIFDHTTSQKGHGYENMSNLNTYPYVSRSDDDDLIDESVETISTIHPCSGQRLSESLSYEIIQDVLSPIKSDHSLLITYNLHAYFVISRISCTHLKVVCQKINQSKDPCTQNTMVISDQRITYTTPTKEPSVEKL